MDLELKSMLKKATTMNRVPFQAFFSCLYRAIIKKEKKRKKKKRRKRERKERGRKEKKRFRNSKSTTLPSFFCSLSSVACSSIPQLLRAANTV